MSFGLWLSTLFSAPQRFALFCLTVQIIFLIVYGTSVAYSAASSGVGNVQVAAAASSDMNADEKFYHYFKDISVMMVVGFGFLMTFLRKYSLSAVSYNLLICAMVIQWAVIMNGSWLSGNTNNTIPISVEALTNALFTLCSVLIAFGAVIGKMSPLQYLVMALCQVPILSWNEFLGRHVLYATDAGDSIFIHSFGAYFGLGVTAVMYKKGMHENEHALASKNSDLFSMIGTLFLWIYWPSFNGGVLEGNSRPRALINTILSLCAATMTTFITMSFMPPMESLPLDAAKKKDSHKRKFIWGNFNMVYVQNSTIAGGVAIGSSCNMMLKPVGALIVGCVAGFFSVLGFRFFTRYMNRYVHDTCGVHNLHGFPSLIAAVASAVGAAVASPSLYGDELYFVFPALSPQAGVTYTLASQTYTTTLNYARSPISQGGFQILAWCHSFGIALVSGVLTGLFLRYGLWFETQHHEECFNDQLFFELGANEPYHTDGTETPDDRGISPKSENLPGGGELVN